MIVGVFPCEDVEVSEGNPQAHTISDEGQIPVSTATSATVGSPKPTTTGDLRMKAGGEGV